MGVTARGNGAFVAGGGKMGARIRAFDWAATPLGASSGWPQTLRTCVRLMLTTRHPVFIFWGADHRCLYNDAYSASLGPEKHPSILGAPGREAWAEIWDVIGPQIDQVMAGGEATWHEDHLVPIIRYGRREDVWWTYSYSPIDDGTEAGGVAGVLVVTKDVTSEHLARNALREGEARWRAVFENMHEGFALCEAVPGTGGAPPDFRYIEVNAAFERLTSLSPAEVVGRLASEAIPGLEPYWPELYNRVVETGVPAHVVQEVAAVGRWFEVFAYRTGPGRFAALFLDVTARRAAEARQELLAREVDHRAKNLLAVVQAAIMLTRADALDTYRAALAGRVAALARAQTVLAADQWDGADLRALLEGELLAFDDAGGRIALDGPPVRLPAGVAQPLAMALHELATNAVKYGALSAPAGRVAVTWRVREARLMLDWHEQGGPALAGKPERRGFGSRVIEATVRGQLGGEVAKRWRPDGLACAIEAPLNRSVEPEPLL
jgi:two-component sensor histidine kinase